MVWFISDFLQVCNFCATLGGPQPHHYSGPGYQHLHLPGVVWYCPTATEVAPWWTTFSCALGLFIYQTLDAIDGKQARRTKTSSPLGELFDHGCDSLSTVFVSLASCCAVRLGLYPGWMLFQCLCASTLFYCAHWQTYVSGTLTFGTIDVTEGQIVVMMVMLTSSIESFLNLDIWSSSVSSILCI